MPVIGHAFCGLAAAHCVPAAGESAPRRALWVPTIVGVAYLPDVLTQLGLMAELPGIRVASHSLLAAIVLAVPVGVGLAWLGRLAWRRGVFLALLLIGLHSLLDALQSTDRLLLWPVWDRPLTDKLTMIPVAPRDEALLFAVLFVVFVVVRQAVHADSPAAFRGASKPAQSQGDGSRGQTLAEDCACVPAAPGFWVVAGQVLAVGILLAAMGTHCLRAGRENQLQQAKTLIRDHEFEEAMVRIGKASRFPAVARPGQIDYLKAVAWEGLDDREQAERYYLASYGTDPWYFWCVADLGFFYAAADLPPEERARLAAPYIRRLKRDFAGHEHQPRMLNRIERRLARPMPSRPATPEADRQDTIDAYPCTVPGTGTWARTFSSVSS